MVHSWAIVTCTLGALLISTTHFDEKPATEQTGLYAGMSYGYLVCMEREKQKDGTFRSYQTCQQRCAHSDNDQFRFAVCTIF